MKKNRKLRLLAMTTSFLLFINFFIGYFEPAKGNEIDFSELEHDNEFYLTQTESVKAYNNMLDGFAKQQVDKNSTNSTCSMLLNENAYPDYYGGAYIQDVTGLLVVLLTENSATFQKEIALMTSENDNIIFEKCDVSFNDMCNTIKYLTDNIKFFREKGIEVTEIFDDIMNGVVKIGVLDLNAEKEAYIKNFAHCDYLEVFDSEYVIPTTNIGGGYELVYPSGDSTIGFAARRNGVNGFVVAGHSGNLGDICTSGGITIGTITATAFNNNSTADASFVTASSNVTPTNILKNNGAIWAAQGSLPINTTVYMYGKISKLQKGTIVSVYQTVPYGKEYDWKIFINQCKASYYSINGDSGAPVLYYEGNYGGQTKYSLVGINAAIGGGYSYYSPYSNIVNELSVSCITG